MAKTKITKRSVDGLEAAEKAFVVYDSELSGFGVRVAPSGSKTYVVEYRPGSGGRSVRSVRLALGRHGVITADEARKLARDRLAQARHGNDPAAQRRQEREAKTVNQIAEIWMSESVVPKLAAGTAILYRHYLDKHVRPALGTRKAITITPADIDALHGKLGKAGTKATANRLSSMISAMFNFAARRSLVPAGFTNPVRGLEKFTEEKRERYLSTAELQRLGAVLRDAETIGISWEPDPTKKTKHAAKPENRREIYSPHVVGAIRLLLLTGCRLREILNLRWGDVDFERGLIFLATSKTGRRAVVLNAPALAVLERLPRAGSYVIASSDPAKPRTDLKKPWGRITEAAELSGLRIHDLRHSFASIGAGGGMGLPIVGKLLGHTQPSTTARYAHLDADPVRAASDRIGNTIAAALENKPLAEVIQLAGIRKQA
jgi:integrase